MSIRSEKDVTPKENAPRVKTAQVASIAITTAELVACVEDKYQAIGLLDEEGNEVLLLLYEQGILKLVYSEDFQIQFNQ